MNLTIQIKLNDKIQDLEQVEMDIFNLYVKKQMNMGNTEFESILMFLNDPDVSEKYKEEYYKLCKRNVVPMDIDMEMDDLGPPPPAPRLTRQPAHKY